MTTQSQEGRGEKGAAQAMVTTAAQRLRRELRARIDTMIARAESWLGDERVKAVAPLRTELEGVRETALLLLEMVDEPSAQADGADAAEAGSVLRRLLRLPVAAILGRTSLIAEKAALPAAVGFNADLRAMEIAARQLLAIAEAVAAHGGEALEGVEHDLLAPRGEDVAALVERFRAGEGRRSSAPGSGSRRVLLVDRDGAERDTLAGQLRGLGLGVTLADDGLAALELIEGEEFDLVLSGLDLPLVNGIELLGCIRTLYGATELPVIMVSPPDRVDAIASALERGANDCLTRPLALQVVTARVHDQLLLKRTADELDKSRHQLETLALHDELTSLANRRSFNEAFDREKRRAQRIAAPLSLVIVDIDHFKPFNDRHGRREGDLAIRRVAEALTRSLGRGTDMAFRYGEEEFVALLPDCPAEGARTVAERIRATVEQLAIPHGASDVAPHLTVSVGAATISQTSGKSYGSLFVRAEQMLIQAKADGRNRVRQYGG